MFYSKKFKKFYNLKHCFFSRKGGFSRGIYKGLNCGRGSKDKKKNIIMNLKKVAKKMSVKNNHLILMYQTHSNKVIEIKNLILSLFFLMITQQMQYQHMVVFIRILHLPQTLTELQKKLQY